MRRDLLVALVMALASLACQERVPLGSGGELGFAGPCGVTEPTTSCPTEAWGTQARFDSVSDAEAQLTGRWLFCGGEQRYTGRSPLMGFSGGSGVEFWKDGSVLRFAFLRGPSPSQRRTDDFAVGTVRLEVDQGRARAVLSSRDGVEAPWSLTLFDQRRVLQNDQFDVWTFVAEP
jgi:hypothetical protein